jgi:hypothetical protein
MRCYQMSEGGNQNNFLQLKMRVWYDLIKPLNVLSCYTRTFPGRSIIQMFEKLKVNF